MRAAAAAVVIALSASGSARAAWSEPEAIPSPGMVAGPVLASDGRDRVALAWADRHGMEVAFARGGGSFGPPVRIPGHSFDRAPREIVIAIDRSGAAAVAWEDCDESRADPLDPDDGGCRSLIPVAARPPGGAFGASKVVSNPGVNSFSPRLALDARHTAVAWEELGGGILSSRADARRRFGRRKYLAFGDFPSLAMGRDGSERYLYAGQVGFSLKSRTAAGRVGRERRISRSRPAYQLRGSFTPKGALSVLWDTGDTPLTLMAGVRRPGHRLRARRLARHRPYGNYQLALAAAPTGYTATAFIWDGIVKPQLAVARREPGQGFGRAYDVPGAHTSVSPAVAVNASRQTLVAWLENDPVAVDAAFVGRRGAVSGVKRFPLAAPLEYPCIDASNKCPAPAVALGRRGEGYLVWGEGTGLRYSRFAAG